MTTYYGVNGGIAVARTGTQPASGVNGGYLAQFAKDYIAVVTSEGDGDRIFLGYVPSDAYLDADLSKLTFDDMGSSITVDIGCDATDPVIIAAQKSNSLAVLTDNLDVATAAGSSSLLASVTTANKHKALWEQLNLAEDPQCDIALYLTWAGNPGTGNLSWKIVGSQ